MTPERNLGSALKRDATSIAVFFMLAVTVLLRPVRRFLEPARKTENAGLSGRPVRPRFTYALLEPSIEG